MVENIIKWAEMGYIPDAIMRLGIAMLVKKRLHQETILHQDPGHANTMLQFLSKGDIAESTKQANDQHYEVPSLFYQKVLGNRLKYSSAFFPEQDTSLDQAEEAMLSMYLDLANIEDGMRILELGCGWGSLTLWLAKNFPNSEITAISNSASQRIYIEEQCKKLGYTHVTIHTVDINAFEASGQYDRIVSVEMFEHLRNYKKLFDNIDRWLTEEGKLFVHIFCHKKWCYLFETQGNDNWMGKYFFTGGVMPAIDTFEKIDHPLTLEERKWISGTHYQKTAAEWNNNLDHHAKELKSMFQDQSAGNHNVSNLSKPNKEESQRWIGRWKMFFMACEELFGYQRGDQWGVGLYRFGKGKRPR